MADAKQKPSVENTVVEYIHFRDLPKEAIKKLPVVQVELTKTKNQRLNLESVQLQITLDPQVKITIRNPRILSVNAYNLVVIDRPDFNEKENVHVANVPARYLERKDEDGKIKYRRIEVMLTRDVVASTILSDVELKLIERRNLKIDWQQDGSKDFDPTIATVDYELY